VSDEQIPLSGEADYRFLSLVMSLATAAWSQLGKVPNPSTQKIEKDVEPDTDYGAVFAGDVSVTPLHLDPTHDESLNHLSHWAKILAGAFSKS